MSTQRSIFVSSVKVVDAGYEVSKYQSSSLVNHSTLLKKLLINGTDTETGESVYFFTPNVNISKCIGFLNYETLRSSNGWFTEIKGSVDGYKGLSMFDGGDTPNVAIVDSTKIVPTVNTGDVIKISGNHCYTSPKNGAVKLNRVKLVS
jgi:hypothetical protein